MRARECEQSPDDIAGVGDRGAGDVEARHIGPRAHQLPRRRARHCVGPRRSRRRRDEPARRAPWRGRRSGATWRRRRRPRARRRDLLLLQRGHDGQGDEQSSYRPRDERRFSLLSDRQAVRHVSAPKEHRLFAFSPCAIGARDASLAEAVRAMLQRTCEARIDSRYRVVIWRPLHDRRRRRSIAWTHARATMCRPKPRMPNRGGSGGPGLAAVLGNGMEFFDFGVYAAYIGIIGQISSPPTIHSSAISPRPPLSASASSRARSADC